MKNIRSILIILLTIIFFRPLTAQQLYFVVIIPSYNNEQWCEKNLLSALEQDYDNYHIVYINDCSADRTYDLMVTLIKTHPRGHKVILINNMQRCGALENLYNAIHSCPDTAIIVTLDGDDWFAHNKVLTTLNHEYTDPNVWITYGSYVSWPANTRDPWIHALPQSIIESKSYRRYPWVTTHLRTFYARLFKLINKEDLLYNNAFFPMTWDLAFMFPMLEMAGNHSRYIEDILYIYNRSNPIGDRATNRSFQIQLEQEIRGKKAYDSLEKLFIT